MNAHPLQPLYPPCLDCAFLKTTTTPTTKDSKIISATPPSVLNKTIEITVVLDVGAEKGTELRVKRDYILLKVYITMLIAVDSGLGDIMQVTA